MENASKALLLAAEVLIGMLVLSLMVYLFITFGSNAAKINKQLENDKLAQFNNQYDKYVNKDDVTIYDIVTVANLAKENNNYYEYYELDEPSEGAYYISVFLESTKLEGEDKNQEYFAGIISNEVLTDGVLPKYDCQVSYSPITGRVKTVKFTK